MEHHRHQTWRGEQNEININRVWCIEGYIAGVDLCIGMVHQHHHGLVNYTNRQIDEMQMEWK